MSYQLDIDALKQELRKYSGFDNEDSIFFEQKSIPEWESENGFYIENGQVVALKLMNLSMYKIPESIALFAHLKVLYLAFNRIDDISGLLPLKQIEYLHLGGNEIKDLSVIAGMKGIKSLYIWDNKVSDLSPLSECRQLVELFVMDNEIKDISVLDGFSKLEELQLGGNPIQDFSALISLRCLKILSLKNLNLDKLDFLLNKDELVRLELSGNKVVDLVNLEQLKKLEYLGLASNSVMDISPLRELNSLKAIDLRFNLIKELPRWLFERKIPIIKHGLDIEEEGFCVTDNPIRNVPQELLSLYDKEIILDYLISLEEGAVPINEVKVILLGEGAAGKTSLVNYLVGFPYNKDQSQTHGINIAECVLPNEVKMKIWDFGGQDIMHHTHQFFLTQKSVYILVLNARENNDSEKWLKLIQVFGGDSPVIIVTNKIDENPSDHENIKHLNSKYPNLQGRYVRVSCESGAGLSEFRKLLAETVDSLYHTKTLWGKSWLGVKNNLEMMRTNNDLKDFIHFERYQEICNQNGVVPSHQDALILWLHRLGVITYFSESGLNETNVINPSWLTEAFYQIINSSIVAGSFGRFEVDQLKNILDVKKYPLQKHIYLVSLMQKFELCYRIDDNTYLIPDLLNKEEPDFSFSIGEALKFKFRYKDLLPKSIFPKLMVRRHEEIFNNIKWRTGMIIQDSNFESSALIKIDEVEREITIWVIGQEKRGYLASIISNLEGISDIYIGLEYEKLVPCICRNCKIKSDPYFYSYDVLKKAKANGRKSYICQKSDRDVDISELLGVLITYSDLVLEIEKVLGTGAAQIKVCLEENDIEGFVSIIKVLFSSVSYLLFEKSEKAYHTPLFLMLRSVFSSNVSGDELQAIGRADIIVELSELVYIFELKLDGSSEDAIRQIHRNRYYQPYLQMRKDIWLVGLNFDSKERNIGDYRYEILNSNH